MQLLIVEDHGLMAQSLAAALQLEQFDVAVVDASDPDLDIFAHTRGHAADLLLLDLDLGVHGSALPLISPLTDAGTDVLVVTGVDSEVRRAECVEAGALAVVSKAAPFDELMKSVRSALDGARLMTEHERQEQLALLRRHRRDRARRFAPFELLTPRERYVLGRLMAGLSAQQIAGEAVVSVSTIRSQIKSILTKLEVRSQVAAIGLARDTGWQPPAG